MGRANVGRRTGGAHGHLLAWALLLMVTAVMWILVIGTLYLEATHGDVRGAEGDWSLLNHVHYLVVTAPLSVPGSLIWGAWMRSGPQGKRAGPAVAILLLLAYGGTYLAFLWNTYPPM